MKPWQLCRSLLFGVVCFSNVGLVTKSFYYRHSAAHQSPRLRLADGANSKKYLRVNAYQSRVLTCYMACEHVANRQFLL